MRLLTVVGARPQFIKAAVVSRALARAGVEEHVVHTGQHYDAEMSDVFFTELGLPAPSHHLGIGGGRDRAHHAPPAGPRACWSTGTPTPPSPGRWRRRSSR